MSCQHGTFEAKLYDAKHTFASPGRTATGCQTQFTAQRDVCAGLGTSSAGTAMC